MNKLKNAWRNRTLREKLIFSSVVCVLLPLVLSFAMMIRLVQDELVHQTVSQSREALEVLDIQMNDYFSHSLYLSNYIRFDDRLHAILLRTIETSEHGRMTPGEQALIDIEISRTLEVVTSILEPSYLTIIVDPGYVYTNYPRAKRDVSPWEKLDGELLQEAGYGIRWLGVQPNYVEEEHEVSPYVISIAGTLELTGRHRATMLISVHETDIRELLDNIRVDSRQEVMLVDGSGTVVSHNNQKMTRKSFPFHELLMTDHTTHHVVDYNGKPYVMVHQLFSFGDWRIVSLIPRQTAIGNIPMIMRNTLVTLLVCFFVFLLLLIGLVSLLTKPLNRLNRVIEQVKNGNLHVRSGLAGRGDIEQLGQSMDTMMDTVNNMIEKIKIAEKSKRKAELEMLQAQINPHFLFNTLNSLRLKISMSGDQDSSNIIRSLSMLLRMTFQRDNEFVPLSKEIEVVRHYLQLMNFKSNSSIDLEENVDPATLDVKVPCFFLQPLIENSILHGFQHKSGKITICSRSQQDGVIVTVSDNGKGLSPDVLKQLQNKLRTVNLEVPVHRNKSSFTGIGLGNVYQRMKLIYGHRFRMEIGSVPSGGTQIVFFIPAQHEV